jgi:hypothetical protein
MIVIVTGSREFTDQRKLVNDLEVIHLSDPNLFIVVGDCPTGADHYATHWAEWMGFSRGVDLKVFKAHWDRKCDQNCYHPPRFKDVDDVLVPYCPVAGHIRNQEMVDFVKDLPELVKGKVIGLAYRKLGAANKGTKDCVQRMKRAGIEVRTHVQK